MISPATRIIFVRHGQTIWNREHRYAGASEVDLSPEAESQIERLTERLRHEQVDAIYASPLTRCLTTITPTAEIHGIRIIKVPELIERNLGDWEGHTPREIHKTHEGYHFPESAYDGSFRVPNSEPLDELEARLRRFLKDVVASHPGQQIVLATHAGVIWMLQKKLVVNPPAELHWAGNCAVVTVEAKDGHLYLVSIEEQDSYLLPTEMSNILE